MNAVQQEQLFADLTPAQAQTITAAGEYSTAVAKYGFADARFSRISSSSFSAKLVTVKDTFKDGFPVYAIFQGLKYDGSIENSGAELLDTKGAAGRGTFYKEYNSHFSQTFLRVRIAILRKNPGRDLFTAGDWADV
jgi:hypothetical protein